MKKTALALLMLLATNHAIYSQEYFIDSIDQKQFTGFYYSGDMAQHLAIPYFSTNKAVKQNFIIKQLNADGLIEERSASFEIPAGYSLKTLLRNDEGMLVIFANNAKKEDVFMSIAGDNIIKKKSFKQNGYTYYNASAVGNTFVLAGVDNKGDYYVESFDKELNSLWKKQYNAPRGTTYSIIGLNVNMGMLQILRKEEENGKYKISKIGLHSDNGEEAYTSAIHNDSVKAYPTFFAEKDGMNYSGGYFYRDAIYTERPDGIYFAILRNDGIAEQVATVPYSRVVEDLKATLGSKLTDKNTTLVFTDMLVMHEMQSYYMTGQLVTSEKTEGGANITLGEYVTLKFSFENEYKGAVATKDKIATIKLKGDVSKTNITDLGIWLKNAGLLTIKGYGFLPGANPILAVKNKQDNFDKLCFINAEKPEKQMPELCVDLTMNPMEAQVYDFNGIAAPVYPVQATNLRFHPQHLTAYYSYELFNNTLRMHRKELPMLEPIRIPIEEPGNEPPAPDEN